eukprot:SAG31_NODE_41130_length_277_cov_1.140449_1_plen_76_part_00
MVTYPRARVVCVFFKKKCETAATPAFTAVDLPGTFYKVPVGIHGKETDMSRGVRYLARYGRTGTGTAVQLYSSRR